MTGKERTLYQERVQKWLSRFVRIRDANEDGYCFCISCDIRIYWSGMHAGHYYSNKSIFEPLRHDENNVHAQCPNCNKFLDGSPQMYREGLVKRHGVAYVVDLDNRRHGLVKRTADDYEVLIAFYKAKVAKIALDKPFYHP